MDNENEMDRQLESLWQTAEFLTKEIRAAKQALKDGTMSFQALVSRKDEIKGRMNVLKREIAKIENG
jgi:chromosome segregation ATPase